MHTVTCRVEGCPKQDQPVELDLTYLDQDTGEPRTVDAVMCGSCGQQISDIQAPAEEPASA